MTLHRGPMKRRGLLVCALSGALGACATRADPASPAALQAQVGAAERAFAQTMAERDLAAFARFVADEAVFLNNGQPLRGRAAVVAHWARFFADPAAPFSWQPDRVEVLPSGALAYSSGPVADPQGKVFARFVSTWRLEAPGVWRVVFDDGYRVCEAPTR